jgi:hypothetical protein
MEIKSDENLLDWFLFNVENGLVCINAQINNFEGPLQFSPTNRPYSESVLLVEEGARERATNERTTNATTTNETATNKTTTAPSKKNTICTK